MHTPTAGGACTNRPLRPYRVPVRTHDGSRSNVYAWAASKREAQERAEYLIQELPAVVGIPKLVGRGEVLA